MSLKDDRMQVFARLMDWPKDEFVELTCYSFSVTWPPAAIELVGVADPAWQKLVKAALMSASQIQFGLVSPTGVKLLYVGFIERIRAHANSAQKTMTVWVNGDPKIF